MTTFQIIEAKPHHCGQMMRIMRNEHQAALARIGTNGHKELRESFDGSCMRRAWLIDGQLAGLGGVMGPSMASSGHIWLAMSGASMKYPCEIVREARRQLDEIMMVKRTLVTTILEGDKTSMRFAVFMGFHAAYEWSDVPALSRDGRKNLVKRLNRDADTRMPICNGYAIVMQYSPYEAA